MCSEMRVAMARASGRVVAQAQHASARRQAGEAEADAALVGGFFASGDRAARRSRRARCRACASTTLTTSAKASKSKVAMSVNRVVD